MEQIKKRYIELFGLEPIIEPLTHLEQALSVKFPVDFVQICEFWNGGIVGGVSLLAPTKGGDASNIFDETIRLQESIKLPSGVIVLADPSESLILYDLRTNRDSSGQIFWVVSNKQPEHYVNRMPTMIKYT